MCFQQINLSKCELLLIEACNDLIVSGIPVKSQVKYVVITIVKDQQQAHLY